MTTADILTIVAAVLLGIVAAVLAATETAFTHLRRAQAEALVEAERRNATILLRLVRRREQVLNPILLLVLTCHLAIATLIGALVERRAGGEWVPLAVAGQVVDAGLVERLRGIGVCCPAPLRVLAPANEESGLGVVDPELLALLRRVRRAPGGA